MDRCHVFEIDDPESAGSEIREHFEPFKDYGEECNGNPLYVWDDGGRYLCRCNKCGKLILVQKSEYIDMCGDGDSYYLDYFPVRSDEEAEDMNRKWSGCQIESRFSGKYLIFANGKFIFRNRELG